MFLFTFFKTFGAYFYLLKSTLFIWAIYSSKNLEQNANQHIRIISEGSCDTEG